MEIRIVPVTLATDTDGVTKTARTGVRSSAYFLSRDTASSSVIFMAFRIARGTSRLLSSLALLPLPTVLSAQQPSSYDSRQRSFVSASPVEHLTSALPNALSVPSSSSDAQ